MTFLCANGRFLKQRAGWLAGLLAVLVAVSGLGVYLAQRKEGQTVNSTNQKIKGIWLNYMEVASLVNGCTLEEYQNNVDAVLANMKDIGLNTLFFHVRSHSDSFYPSSVFPWSTLVNQGAGVEYDPLEIVIEKAHSLNISVHAWVNPYRVSAHTLSELPGNHPAVLLKTKESTAVVETETGVYYNPDHASVRELVLKGVKEILENYKVDGVQYDDYFYPTTKESFDAESYNAYCQTTDYPLPLGDYRRAQVNLLIAETHRLVSKHKGVVFGVSPAAGLEKNRDTLYADASAWVQGGYVDYLCPQLYFGFNYPLEGYRFDALFARWKQLAGEVPLYIGLASYKVGQMDNNSEEWVTSTDLLARQTAWCKEAQGICIYHYSSFIKSDEQSKMEREALKTALAGW